MDLGAIRLSDFAGLIGSLFRVPTTGGGEVFITLVEAAPLPYPAIASDRESFSLIFRGPKDRPLQQNIHPTEHEKLGPLALFLVPIGPGKEGDGLYYQAVFH